MTGNDGGSAHSVKTSESIRSAQKEKDLQLSEETQGEPNPTSTQRSTSKATHFASNSSKNALSQNSPPGEASAESATNEDQRRDETPEAASTKPNSAGIDSQSLRKTDVSAITSAEGDAAFANQVNEEEGDGEEHGDGEEKDDGEEESGAETDEEDDEGATVDRTMATSTASPDGNDYVEGPDGNIHINEEQKAAIRRLTQPDEADDIHLGFTKQGKPIVANPYFKYALRHRDVAEDAKPPAPSVTEPHSSRLTRRSRRDSAQLPMGPSLDLEKIKNQFCEWLSSLGSRRNLTISKERLDELFSLGLENNVVVRPPEVRMIRPGHSSPTSEHRGRQHQQHGEQPSVAFCRSPSLTYYPELRERWRLMGQRDKLPTWRAGYHPAGRPPPPSTRYGNWYIPVHKWTPLVGQKRLTPPETEEARQLRKHHLQNVKLNEVLSRSHALYALREYIRICQLQGNSSFPEVTPNMIRDVDELLTGQAHRAPAGGRRHRLRSSQRVLVHLHDDSSSREVLRRPMPTRQRRRSSTIPAVRDELGLRPPPRYEPTKTEPGLAATRRKSRPAEDGRGPHAGPIRTKRDSKVVHTRSKRGSRTGGTAARGRSQKEATGEADGPHQVEAWLADSEIAAGGEADGPRLRIGA